MSRWTPPKRYKTPEWMRVRRKNCPFTPEEQNRIILNAGRITVNDMAKLMHRCKKTIWSWARSHGISIAVSLHRPHNYPATRKSVRKENPERMMELSRRIG